MADDIQEMTRKVKIGLDRAKQLVADDPLLLGLISNLEQTWDHHAAELLMLASGLSAFRFRDRAQTAAVLRHMQGQIDGTACKPFSFSDHGSVAH